MPLRVAKTDDNLKIKILQNGPYMVTGGVPLKEETIVLDMNGKADKWKEVKKLYPECTYMLCRCGKSRDKPFCTGDHTGCDLTETAPRNTYDERASVVAQNNEIKLKQDFSLCVRAGFCHGKSHVDKNIEKKETLGTALQQTYDCPGGSLLILIDKEKKEPKFEKCISATTTPSKTGPLFVKGGIPVHSSDGYVYEVRNRVALCTCGKSKNKPFCDGMHNR